MFISFEGGEGSGKSTAMRVVAERLQEQGFEVVTTREPGGTATAEAIRQVILDYEMDPITEALLFAAARREHVVKKIKPLLDKGIIVMSDRFIDSSLSYQGFARDVGFYNIIDINKRSIEVDGENILPDIVFYLDVDPEEGLRRVSERTKVADRLDNEKITFHDAVRSGFLVLSELNPRYEVIDANKSLEDVIEEVYSIIKKKLEEKD